MKSADFWASILNIASNGFTPDGLRKLDQYAEYIINGRIVYQRFSPLEQHGCSEGGATNVIATLLAGAETASDCIDTPTLNDFQRDCKRAAQQEALIEGWARSVGCWIDVADDSLEQTLGAKIAEGGEAKVYDHGATLIKSIGLDYFIQPALALDRIALHNAYFPETRLYVLGFGRDTDDSFKIIAEQPYIQGSPVCNEEIAIFMNQMGFELRNPRNWTYATPDIYLSDMHDENVIRSDNGTIFVVDCDIRINTTQLNEGGRRCLSTDIIWID